MKVVALYCPNCGAPVGKDAKFCSQCGSPIVIDDGVIRSEHIHREIDEARIREATAEERIQLHRIELQLEKERQKALQDQQWFKTYPIIMIIGCIFLLLIIFITLKLAS